MRRLARFLLPGFLLCAAVQQLDAQEQPAPAESEAQTSPASVGQLVTVPAATRISLAVTAPVWSRTAQPGDTFNAMTDYPVTSERRIAIPAGVSVQGNITRVALPSNRTRHAEIDVLLTRLVFANGYVVRISDRHPDQDHPGTAVKISIQPSPASDLLLDNGARFQITLAAPITLDPKLVADAMAATRPTRLRSAILCQPAPGAADTPRTPDTLTPGRPGMPSTTVPGGPSMPDISNPATPDVTNPGTSSTPATVIPETPDIAASPGSGCPSPPMVLSSTPIPFPAKTN
jgi:hypothetical protein